MLLVLLAGSVAPAQTDWWTKARVFRTRYYNVKTDLPEQQAEELATHMDITAQAYALLFAGLKIRRPAVLDVYLFAEQGDFRQIVRERFGSDPTGSWGQCITRDSNISLVAWRGNHSVEAMKQLLQHEGFHQFASHLFPGLPSWANEGLAEVFERGVAVNGTIVLGEVTPSDKQFLTAAATSGQLRPFREIITMPSQQWGHQVRQGSAQLNYLQAWSMTHFLLYGDHGKYQQPFLNFLVALNQGVRWEQAFVASFGMPDFSVMENLWRRHLQTLAPTDYRETIRRLEFLAAGLVELRKKEIYPQSVGELTAGLQQIKFQHESELFGETRTLSAADANLCEVPYADSSSRKCTFQLVDNRGRKPKADSEDDRSKSKLKRRASPPMNIVTDGIEPRDFIVRWKQDKAREYQPLLGVRPANR